MDDYWRTWEARQRQYTTRLTRTRRIKLDAAPGQKRRKGSQAVNQRIREQIAEELRQHRWMALTGPVVLGLHFVVAPDRQPAQLPKLTKSLLDVLGADKAGAHEGPALYTDDRQIEMLHASFGRTFNKSSVGTYVTARPLRDVVADLRLAHEIERHDRRRDESDSPFFSEELDDDDESPEHPFLPDDVEEQIRRVKRHWQQRVLLQRTGAHIRSLLAGAPERVHGATKPPKGRTGIDPRSLPSWDELERARDRSWRLLLSQPFAVPMPPMPRRHGERELFNETVASELKQFADRWRSMVPLASPVNITILVTPSRHPLESDDRTAGNQELSQGNDLDNVALTVLPAVQRAFHPEAPDDLSIDGFQAIRLARREDDPPQGRLQVVLAGENPYRSDWGWISRHAGERLDRLVDQDR